MSPPPPANAIEHVKARFALNRAIYKMAFQHALWLRMLTHAPRLSGCGAVEVGPTCLCTPSTERISTGDL